MKSAVYNKPSRKKYEKFVQGIISVVVLWCNESFNFLGIILFRRGGRGRTQSTWSTPLIKSTSFFGRCRPYDVL